MPSEPSARGHVLLVVSIALGSAESVDGSIRRARGEGKSQGLYARISPPWKVVPPKRENSKPGNATARVAVLALRCPLPIASSAVR